MRDVSVPKSAACPPKWFRVKVRHYRPFEGVMGSKAVLKVHMWTVCGAPFRVQLSGPIQNP